MKYKYTTLIIPFLLLTTISNGQEKNTLYYSNLFNLKTASDPRQVTMARFENYTENQPALTNGIFFTYKNRKAGQVLIAGSFSYWDPQLMRRSKHGVWYFFLPHSTAKNKISYKFLVDGTWVLDPLNDNREDDKVGSHLSVTYFDRDTTSKYISYKIMANNLVEFRTYKPQAKIISVVGDFNNWNPEQDLMIKKEDGTWNLKKKLPNGIYRYKFIIDGRWEPDYYNPHSAADINGEMCSLIKIN